MSDCFKKANNEIQNYELEYNLNQDCFCLNGKNFLSEYF